jgi:hypothetical protein
MDNCVLLPEALKVRIQSRYELVFLWIVLLLIAFLAAREAVLFYAWLADLRRNRDSYLRQTHRSSTAAAGLKGSHAA